TTRDRPGRADPAGAPSGRRPRGPNLARALPLRHGHRLRSTDPPRGGAGRRPRAEEPHAALGHATRRPDRPGGGGARAAGIGRGPMSPTTWPWDGPPGPGRIFPSVIARFGFRQDESRSEAFVWRKLLDRAIWERESVRSDSSAAPSLTS